MTDYDKHTINSSNPAARLAHRSRFARAVNLVEGATPESGTVLDFGSGTGSFLKLLRQSMLEAKLYAFEPYMENQANTQFEYVEDVNAFSDASIDTIGSFEVLEHLSDENIDDFFDLCVRKLKPNGAVIVSVPIMIGLSLPIKELNRSIFTKFKRTYSILELMRGTLGFSVQRADNRLKSHKGFDYREILDRFDKKKWKIETQFSPFSGLGWSLNSQIFMIARPIPKR